MPLRKTLVLIWVEQSNLLSVRWRHLASLYASCLFFLFFFSGFITSKLVNWSAMRTWICTYSFFVNSSHINILIPTPTELTKCWGCCHDIITSRLDSIAGTLTYTFAIPFLGCKNGPVGFFFLLFWEVNVMVYIYKWYVFSSDYIRTSQSFLLNVLQFL